MAAPTSYPHFMPVGSDGAPPLSGSSYYIPVSDLTNAPIAGLLTAQQIGELYHQTHRIAGNISLRWNTTGREAGIGVYVRQPGVNWRGERYGYTDSTMETVGLSYLDFARSGEENLEIDSDIDPPLADPSYNSRYIRLASETPQLKVSHMVNWSHTWAGLYVNSPAGPFAYATIDAIRRHWLMGPVAGLNTAFAGFSPECYVANGSYSPSIFVCSQVYLPFHSWNYYYTGSPTTGYAFDDRSLGYDLQTPPTCVVLRATRASDPNKLDGQAGVTGSITWHGPHPFSFPLRIQSDVISFSRFSNMTNLYTMDGVTRTGTVTGSVTLDFYPRT